METKLNQLLADFVVEYHKLQTFHWYVKGKDFFTVHAKLEEYYDHVNENIDEVAEHILMLNMKPLASLQEFLKVSSITEAHGEFVCSQDILKEVLKDFEYLLNEVKELKKYIDRETVTSDGYLYFTLYKSSLDAQTAVCIMTSHK